MLPFTDLNDPLGVAVDRAGTVYVTDLDSNRVLKLAAGSSTQKVVPFTGLNHLMGVAVDSTGAVYVTDTENDRVLKLAAGSSTQQVLPFAGLKHPEGQDGGMALAEGLAVDSAGTVYVADTHNDRVVKLAAGSLSRRCCPSPASTVPRVLQWMLPAPSTSPIPATSGC